MGTLRVYKGKENQVLGITYYENGKLYGIRRGFVKRRYSALRPENLKVETEAEVVKENRGRITLRTKSGIELTIWKAK